MVAVFLAMFCLVTLFYRQWEDGDRFHFPLQIFLIELTQGAPGRGLDLFRSRAFWIGAGLCIVHLSLIHLNRFDPDVPHLSMILAPTKLLPEGAFRDALESLSLILI